MGLLICASYIARSAPGARPAAATPAVQPPCQHTRHLSDHFRASTLPKGAGRRKQCVQAVYRRPGPGSLWGDQIMAVRDVYASKKKGTRIYVTEAM